MRRDRAGHDNIESLLVEIVRIEGQTAVEGRKVHTDIVRTGLFPAQHTVGKLRHRKSGCGRTSERIVLVDGIVSHLVTVRAHGLTAHYAVGRTDLEQIDLFHIEEFFPAEVPRHHDRRK